MRFTRTSVLGCPVDRIDFATLLTRAREALRSGQRLTIEGINVAKLIAARDDALLMDALNAASIVHADGAGITLAARLLGLGLPPRRAGIDLMMDLIALCAEEHAGIFLLGATNDVVTKTAAALRRQFPALTICGAHDGYFAEEEAATIAAAIAASGAKLLLIGISSPKKEVFLHRHGTACNVAIAMGVGGSFDIVAGMFARAPRWMQRIGCEWVFRLLQEPRRLGRRYLTSNLRFAGLLLRALQAPSPVPDWQAFLEMLRSGFSDDALACRHEIYFLHRKYYGARARAVAALMRDLWLLLRTPVAPSVPPHMVAVATLPGSSGYGTVQRAMDALAPRHNVALIAHPRVPLAAAALRPARIRWRDTVTATFAAWRHLRHRCHPLSRVIVASCIMRHHLWRASWRAYADRNPHWTHALLHNDFDMMNSALICALAPQVKTMCVQHGIPTAEFFPTRAPIQIVWGDSSRAIYAAQAPEATLVIDALGRLEHAAVPQGPPQAIYLLSQTHTSIFGLDLRVHFEALAAALAPHAPLHILLHPEEVKRRGLYAPFSACIARPPHALLHSGRAPVMVVGFASTALFEAAAAGHYVAVMQWPARQSESARDLCRAPMQCADAQAVLAFYHRLRESEAARRTSHAAQHDWLEATFRSTQRLANYGF